MENIKNIENVKNIMIFSLENMILSLYISLIFSCQPCLWVELKWQPTTFNKKLCYHREATRCFKGTIPWADSSIIRPSYFGFTPLRTIKYVGCIVYADDIIILSCTSHGLQHLLNTCYENCSQFKVSV